MGHFDPEESSDVESILEDIRDSSDMSEWFNSAIKNFMTHRFFDGRKMSPIDDYLQRQGWRESKPVRRFLKALLDSRLSIYEVIEIDRDKNKFTLRDFFMPDKIIQVSHPHVPKTSVIWDCIAARIIVVGQKPQLMSSLVLNRATARRLVVKKPTFQKEFYEGMKEADKESTPSLTIEEKEDFFFTLYAESCINTWLIDRIEEILETEFAVSNSSDFDQPVPVDVHFALRGERDEIIAKLNEFAEFERIEESEVWLWINTASSSDSMAEQRNDESDVADYSTADSEFPDVPIHGYVVLKEKSLMLSANTELAASEGRAKFENYFGKMLGHGLISIESADHSEYELDDLIEREDVDLPSRQITNRVRELELAAFERHYRSFFTVPIPMYDGKSLKQAVKSKRYRTQVIDWAKLLESYQSRKSIEYDEKLYDASWIWDELNVDPNEW